MFGKRKASPVVIGGRVEYIKEPTKKDLKQMKNVANGASEIMELKHSLETMKSFLDMSLKTAADPNTPLENKAIRNARTNDMISVRREMGDIVKKLKKYGVLVDQRSLSGGGKVHYYEEVNNMRFDAKSERMAIYEATANGTISEALSSYFLANVAYMEASYAKEESTELVREYLQSIQDGDYDMADVCKEELSERPRCTVNVQQAKEDLDNAYNALGDNDKHVLELLQKDNDIDNDSMEDDKEDISVIFPHRPAFMKNYDDDDKNRLLGVLEESVRNDIVSFSRSKKIEDLIEKHMR